MIDPSEVAEARARSPLPVKERSIVREPGGAIAIDPESGTPLWPPQPDLPDLEGPEQEYRDVPADAWEPLLAIADAAGGSWPARARQASIILHGDRADDDSLGLRMLADTRLVFDRVEVDRLSTTSLIDELKADEESPWVDDHKPLTPERLATFLRPFGIRSRQLKIAGGNVRGFLRESFTDSWDRYLSEPATPRTDPLPRYPTRAAGSEVAGYSGGSGSDDDVGIRPPTLTGASVSDEFAAIFEAARQGELS